MKAKKEKVKACASLLSEKNADIRKAQQELMAAASKPELKAAI